MAPTNSRRNKKINQNNIATRILQHLIRSHCCWNCFQLGHNRHQCPFPRSISCSYCRRPGVYSNQCKCTRRNSQVRYAQYVEYVPSTSSNYENTVHVPNTEKNNIESQRENLVVFINNNSNKNNEEHEEHSEQEEYLEIDAEDESLEDL